MKADRPSKILAGVSDIFFASKISATAKLLGVSVEFAGSREAILAGASSPPALIILDLDQKSLDPVALIGELKGDPAMGPVPVVAFANHTRTDLIEGARQAGCDEVLTRGAFSSALPQMLRRRN